MKKQEFISLVVEKLENKVSKKTVDEVIKTALDTVGEALAQGDSISFVDFGSFSITERAEREGVNPATGEKIKIPARKAVKFKAGKKLKDLVNK